MNIYVGNLPFDTNEDEVRGLFAVYGEVASVSLIKDKFSGQLRGFGFVEMPNVAEAKRHSGIDRQRLQKPQPGRESADRVK